MTGGWWHELLVASQAVRRYVSASQPKKKGWAFR